MCCRAGRCRGTFGVASSSEAKNSPNGRKNSQCSSSWNSSEYTRERSSGSEGSDVSQRSLRSTGTLKQWAAESRDAYGSGNWQSISVPAMLDSLDASRELLVSTGAGNENEHYSGNISVPKNSPAMPWLSQHSEEGKVLYVSPCLCKERIIESPFCSSALTTGLWKQKSKLDKIFDEGKGTWFWSKFV